MTVSKRSIARHLVLADAEGHVARYYSSERGYYEPERATEESDAFCVCPVSSDGDIHTAGSVRQTAGSLSRLA